MMELFHSNYFFLSTFSSKLFFKKEKFDQKK
jgi:hypothetical protein